MHVCQENKNCIAYSQHSCDCPHPLGEATLGPSPPVQAFSNLACLEQPAPPREIEHYPAGPRPNCDVPPSQLAHEASALLGHRTRFAAIRAGNAWKLEQKERRLRLEAKAVKDRESRRDRVNIARQSLQRAKHAVLVESELEQQSTRVRRHTDKVRFAAARRHQESGQRDKCLLVKKRREERSFRRQQIQESLAFSGAFVRSQNTATRHVQLGHNERRKACLHQRICARAVTRRKADSYRRAQVLIALEKRFNARRAAVLTQTRVLRQKLEWRRALDDQEQQLALVEKQHTRDLQELLSSIRAASGGVFAEKGSGGDNQRGCRSRPQSDDVERQQDNGSGVAGTEGRGEASVHMGKVTWGGKDKCANKKHLESAGSGSAVIGENIITVNQTHQRSVDSINGRAPGAVTGGARGTALRRVRRFVVSECEE